MNRLIFIYAGLLVLFSLFSYLFIDVNLPYLHFLYSGFALSYRLLVSIIYAVLIFGFSIFYVQLLKTEKISVSYLKKLIFASIICLIVSYPAVLSYDIFNYMSTAKVTYFYHENPYLVMPIEFPGDPMLLYTRAANKFALYGPTWIGLTAVPFFMGLGNFILQMFLFKALVGAFYIGICLLIYKLSRSTKDVLFFALNPLVLIETFISGHNDVVMMFFVLLTFLLMKNNKLFASTLSLVVSIFVKFASFILLPVFVYSWWMHMRGKGILWNKMWLLSAACMFVVFLLSAFREEIYPWYAIWFIPFVALLEGHKNLKALTIALSVGLLLYYIPYMLLGVYSHPTPILKALFVIFPVITCLSYLGIKKYGKNI